VSCACCPGSPNLEIYSINEAFLGRSGFDARLEAHARELRQTVFQWTGIPVSVGIAPMKRDPVTGGVRCPLDEASQREALAGIELTDLWGITRRLAARLNAIGITTPLELRDADHRLIRERFSIVLERMVLELRGFACIGLEEVSPDRKSLIASRSFGQAIETRRGRLYLYRAEVDLRAIVYSRPGRLGVPPGRSAVQTNARAKLQRDRPPTFISVRRFRHSRGALKPARHLLDL
jgi:nucleotidyltransferase/DNA polymerase involved in DNA repair